MATSNTNLDVTVTLSALYSDPDTGVLIVRKRVKSGEPLKIVKVFPDAEGYELLKKLTDETYFEETESTENSEA